MADEDGGPPANKLEETRQHPFRKYWHPRNYPTSFENVSQFIRRNFVLPFRVKEPPVYYHRKFERVPSIDQCEVEDAVCIFEAEEQWRRDKKVDNMKLKIMRKRLTECYEYWQASGHEKCLKEKDEWEQNTVNWFIKYGDLHKQEGPIQSYMKQKHRMIFLRRKRAEGIDVAYNEDRTY